MIYSIYWHRYIGYILSTSHMSQCKVYRPMSPVDNFADEGYSYIMHHASWPGEHHGSSLPSFPWNSMNFHLQKVTQPGLQWCLESPWIQVPLHKESLAFTSSLPRININAHSLPRMLHTVVEPLFSVGQPSLCLLEGESSIGQHVYYSLLFPNHSSVCASVSVHSY
jgi:hypothetical protein